MDKDAERDVMDGERQAGEVSDAVVPRRVRLEDVASRLGVSTATVSLALRNAPGPSLETRARVVEAARHLGYRPDRVARALAQENGQTIGVVTNLRDRFHAMLVERLYEAADSRNCELVLSAATRSRSELRAAETLLDSRCDALILLGPHEPDADILRLSEQRPVVVVGRKVVGPNIDVVHVPDETGIGVGVRFLAGLGHRRIAYADGGSGPAAKDRRDGYTAAMSALGLTMHASVFRAGHSRASSQHLAEVICALDPRPTAVASSDDECALALIEALARLGVSVPDQVSVLGYDDSPVSRLGYVELSSVSQNPTAQARVALSAAVERLQGQRTTPVEVLVEPKVVRRRTTAPTRLG